MDEKKYIHKRYVASKNDDGKVVAYCDYSHMPNMFHPKKFWVMICVHPKWQNKGIGSSLYNLIMEELHKLGAVCIRTSAKEDMIETVSFLMKRGFKEKMRSWEYRLNVDDFDFSRFANYLERVKDQGIGISTLAEEEIHDSRCYNKLYELVKSLMADVPMPDNYTPLSFDEFVNYSIRHPDVVKEAYFIAKDGNSYVGMSSVYENKKSPLELHHGLTGVLKDYRGRGIAMALKLSVIDFAKHNGYKVIKTWNDSTNVAILALNSKLGFIHHAGWITFEKIL